MLAKVTAEVSILLPEPVADVIMTKFPTILAYNEFFIHCSELMTSVGDMTHVTSMHDEIDGLPFE